MRNRTSDLRIPRSNALPLSHRDSTVSEVGYEVLPFFMWKASYTSLPYLLYYCARFLTVYKNGFIILFCCCCFFFVVCRRMSRASWDRRPGHYWRRTANSLFRLGGWSWQVRCPERKAQFESLASRLDGKRRGSFPLVSSKLEAPFYNNAGGNTRLWRIRWSVGGEVPSVMEKWRRSLA